MYIIILYCFVRKLTNFNVKLDYVAPDPILLVLVCQDVVQELKSTQDFMSVISRRSKTETMSERRFYRLAGCLGNSTIDISQQKGC